MPARSLFFYWMFSLLPDASCIGSNPLNGRNLRVLAMEVCVKTYYILIAFLYCKVLRIIFVLVAIYQYQQMPISLVTQRNATGHIIYAEGTQRHMIDALSETLLKMIPKIGIFSTPKKGKSSQKQDTLAVFGFSLRNWQRVPNFENKISSYRYFLLQKTLMQTHRLIQQRH